MFALTAAALVMIVAAAAARAWSFFTDDSIVDAPVWSWAPGGAGALAILAVIVSFGGTFLYFWRGAHRQVLEEVGAVPLDPTVFPQIVNVVEALSIGLGHTMPSLYVVDDPVPNAVSIRSTRQRALCVTSGSIALTRDQFEAICAHELAHLWAPDSHWVTSGMVALARARRFGAFILTLGTLLLVLVMAVAYYGDAFLWGTGVVAIGLLLLGWLSRGALRRLELRVRRQSDEIADVCAVMLAKNPASLGSVCVQLASDPRRVSRIGWRSELMWFEAVEELTDGAAAAGADARTRSELVKRALKAYAEARVPPPAELASAAIGIRQA